MSQRLYISHTRAEKNDRFDSPNCTWPNSTRCELDHDWTAQHRPRWWPVGGASLRQRLKPQDRRGSETLALTDQILGQRP